MINYNQNTLTYYSNLINTLKLFSFSKLELEKLEGPTFDPIFELASELEQAFLPIYLERIFQHNLIDTNLEKKLLDFKKQADQIPSEIWDWGFLKAEVAWISIRKKANELLDELGILDRKVDEID